MGHYTTTGCDSSGLLVYVTPGPGTMFPPQRPCIGVRRIEKNQSVLWRNEAGFHLFEKVYS